jgi:alpha-beta hydrolase superfamily lysophospholipase
MDKLISNEKLIYENLSRTEEFVTNNREQILHVRSSWPKKTKFIVVFLHGYASHGARPTHQHLGKEFNNNEIAYITLDFHGHGYSEGLRAHVKSVNDLIDDATSLLKALYSNENEITERNSFVRKFYLNQYADINTPFYIMGHSMGGGTSILLANRINTLQEYRGNLRLNFKGCLFVAPAIEFPNKPNIFLTLIMNYIMAPCFGEKLMSTSSNTTSSTITIPSPLNIDQNGDPLPEPWDNSKYLEYIQNDSFPNGLGWNNPIRYETANSLLTLSSEVTNVLESITFPFIVFHDSDDKVVNVEGSLNLINLSRTPIKDKIFVEVIDGQHDPISNQIDFVTNHCIQWILREN